jgi:hypothetical protein
LKNDVNVPSKSKKQKREIFLLAFYRFLTKRAEFEARSKSGQKYGSEDPDPNQNVTDPEHWFSGSLPSL